MLVDYESEREEIKRPKLPDSWATSGFTRTRATPHRVGMYSSLVYIPLSCHNISFKINQLFALNYTESELFHVSLSRQFYLEKNHLISFKNKITALKYPTNFIIKFKEFRCYWNHDKSCCFLSLVIDTGHNILHNCTKLIDQVLIEYNLDPYYSVPEYHVSIGWSDKDLTCFLNDLNSRFDSLMISPVLVDTIVLNIGCKTTNISL